MIKNKMSGIIPGTNLEGLVQGHHFHFINLVLGVIRDLLDGLTHFKINLMRNSILVSCLGIVLVRDCNTFGGIGKLGYMMVVVFHLEHVDLLVKVPGLDMVNAILGVIIVFIMLILVWTILGAFKGPLLESRVGRMSWSCSTYCIVPTMGKLVTTFLAKSMIHKTSSHTRRARSIKLN